MANPGDSGDRAEKAPPKRLRDACRRDVVPTSRDVTNTLGLAFTMALFALAVAASIDRLASLTVDSLGALGREQPVPLVTAKAGDATANAMRSAATAANVPVLGNERLARTLLADVDVVPRELFDVLAEGILWTARTNETIVRARNETPAWTAVEPPGDAPGKDLTEYPSGVETWLMSEPAVPGPAHGAHAT